MSEGNIFKSTFLFVNPDSWDVGRGGGLRLVDSVDHLSFKPDFEKWNRIEVFATFQLGQQTPTQFFSVGPDLFQFWP